MNTSSLTYQRATARWFALPLATILIAVAASIVQAKTFNVATLAELNAALKGARPGDNIVMADGVWRDAVINFSAQATAEQPVILRAQTPGKVFLTGASKITLNSPFLVVDGMFFKDGSSEDGSPVIAFKSHHGRITNTAIVNFMDEIQLNVDSIKTGKESQALPENYDNWIRNLARADRGVSSPRVG